MDRTLVGFGAMTDPTSLMDPPFVPARPVRVLASEDVSVGELLFRRIDEDGDRIDRRRCDLRTRQRQRKRLAASLDQAIPTIDLDAALIEPCLFLTKCAYSAIYFFKIRLEMGALSPQSFQEEKWR